MSELMVNKNSLIDNPNVWDKVYGPVLINMKDMEKLSDLSFIREVLKNLNYKQVITITKSFPVMDISSPVNNNSRRGGAIGDQVQLTSGNLFDAVRPTESKTNQSKPLDQNIPFNDIIQPPVVPSYQALIPLPGPEKVITIRPIPAPDKISLVENRAGLLSNLSSEVLVDMIQKSIDAPDRNNYPPFRISMVSDTKGGAGGQRYKVEVLKEIIKKFGAKPEGKKENLSLQVKKLWYEGEGQVASKLRELIDARRFDLIALAEFGNNNTGYVEKLWKDSNEKVSDFIEAIKRQEGGYRAALEQGRAAGSYAQAQLVGVKNNQGEKVMSQGAGGEKSQAGGPELDYRLTGGRSRSK